MFTIKANYHIDFILSCLHYLFQTNFGNPEDSEGNDLAIKTVRLFDNLDLQPLSTSLLNLIETHDLDIYSLLKQVVSDNSSNSGETVDDKSKLALRGILKAFSQSELLKHHWEEKLIPYYTIHEKVFHEWLVGHDPISLLEPWLGKPLKLHCNFISTLFLPPPPDGRFGMLTKKSVDSIQITLAFGLPRYGHYQQFGMHPAWLKRGMWHYLVGYIIQQVNLDDMPEYQAFIGALQLQYPSVDSEKLQRLAFNYIARSFSVVALELNKEVAIQHLRGSAYLLAPWICELLIQGFKTNMDFSTLLRKTLNHLTVRMGELIPQALQFSGTLKDCTLEYWITNARIVVHSNSVHPVQQRRIQALQRCLGFSQVVDETENSWLEHSHWFIGDMTHPFVSKALSNQGFKIDKGCLVYNDKVLSNKEWVLTFLQVHPLNHNNWSAITTTVSKELLAKLGHLPWYSDADYVVVTEDELISHGYFVDDKKYHSKDI